MVDVDPCLQSKPVSIAVHCYKTPVLVSIRFYKNARIHIRTFLQKCLCP